VMIYTLAVLTLVMVVVAVANRDKNG